MKKIIFYVLFSLCLFVALNVYAEEISTTALEQNQPAGKEVTVALSVPFDLATKICPVPKWSNQVIWDGVSDNRTEKYIGVQDMKDEPDILIKAEPAIDKVFAQELYKLLSTCGLKLVSSGLPDDPHLGFEINVFYAGAKKNILTGQAEAKSEISISQRKGGNASKLTINVELQSKDLRSKKLSRLEKTLNELLVETLKKIAEQDSIGK